MVKTYLKTLVRTFTHHITRLVSIALMVLVSVGFTAGVLMATEKMANSLSEYYSSANVSDFIVRTDSEIDEEKIEKVKELFGEENVARGGILELENGTLHAENGNMGVDFLLENATEGITRVYVKEENNQNKTKALNSFSIPEESSSHPVSFEHVNKDLKGFELGKEMNFSLTAQTPFGEMTLGKLTLLPAEEVVCPLHFAEYDDPSMKELEEDEYQVLENIVYITVDDGHPLPSLPMNMGPMVPMNELYISSQNLKKHALFSPAYDSELKKETSMLEEIFREEIDAETAGVLTLRENFSFASWEEYEGKIRDIGYVLAVVFLLVTLLVVLSTMTRLLEEERGQIACLQTLGYSPIMMLSKYLLFALVGTVIGGVGALFAGEGLSYIIFINFKWNYYLPAYSHAPAPLFFILTAALILASTLAATGIAGWKMTRTRPAVLLRPKTPRAGKKVILERIPILWNRFSFKYKSTLRNVLRYRTRFWMTVIAVMASTALVLAGLAVLDACLFQDIGTGAMIAVAVIVLVFAALLNAVVIYTLTNINISERVRELATLMVLGYQDNEVTGYIYREIYITSAVGILLGVPFGALLCLFVFSVMGFGSLPAMGWYTWIVAPILSLLFTFLVTLMLRGKIVKINMNDSLKAIE